MRSIVTMLQGFARRVARAARALPATSAASLCAMLAMASHAHDIPDDVKVRAFVRPLGNTLDLVVRVPMAAMQDVDFPRRGPGYLDVARAEATLRTAASLWLADNISVYESDRKLDAPTIAAIRVSLPSDTSFATLDGALAHFADPPLDASTELYWNQGLLDVRFAYAIESDGSSFAIDPRLERLGLRTRVSLVFAPPAGNGNAERAFDFHGNPGIVRLDPRWHQAALRFVEAGFLHILDGTDHLLFIACLVIPFRRLKPLAVIVTGFTVAHSVTLIASAFGWAPGALWFPPLVETLIAASIVYMAIENIVGGGVERRWMVAFVFGLVHGFGFSFALRESLQFAGSHLVTSLLAFNVGVEIGQLLVLVILVPLLALLFGRVSEGIGVIVLSVLIAHTAWHWMTERGEKLLRFPMPPLDASTIASAMRWAIAAIVVGVLLWAARRTVRRLLVDDAAAKANVGES